MPPGAPPGKPQRGRGAAAKPGGRCMPRFHGSSQPSGHDWKSALRFTTNSLILPHVALYAIKTTLMTFVQLFGLLTVNCQVVR